MVFEALVSTDSPGICRQKLHNLKEYRLLFSLLPFRELVSQSKPRPDLEKALLNWSSDLLVKIILQVEQEFLSRCPKSPKVSLSLLELKRVFLRRLGVAVSAEMTETDVAFLFRALLSQKDDASAIQKKVEALPPPQRSDSNPVLKAVFGGEFAVVRGVLVVGPSVEVLQTLRPFLEEVCPGTKACLFWDPRWIYRVMVSPQKGVAAYLPELALLIVSEELLRNQNLLTKVVLLHELAHVAERGAELLEDKKWKEAFSQFSGWTVKKGKWSAEVEKAAGVRNDELTLLSKGSAFSLGADPVYVGKKKKEKTYDGFVLGKSYEQSLLRKDTSEDLADHVAVFRFYPERFCFQNKPIAPGKFRWLAENIFSEAPPLSCFP